MWKGPYGNIKVSPIRQEIINELNSEYFQVNDSMQIIEHSVEALLPFLQHQNNSIEIVSILIPYMSFDRMNNISVSLSEALNKVISNRDLKWGEDIAFVISNDAVHYGDQDWGGGNYAKFGADSNGYQQAMIHENEIIQCISDEVTPDKIQQFCSYTVMEDNFKEYKWTWCGRYSVPFGLLTAYHLNNIIYDKPLSGIFLGYSSSIDHDKIDFEDLNMGITAPANIRHWVGYAAIGYK